MIGWFIAEAFVSLVKGSSISLIFSISCDIAGSLKILPDELAAIKKTVFRWITVSVLFEWRLTSQDCENIRERLVGYLVVKIDYKTS